jgi:hypothetical protein
MTAGRPVRARSRLAGVLRRGFLAAPQGSSLARLLDAAERRLEHGRLGVAAVGTELVRRRTHLRVAVVEPGVTPEQARHSNLELVLDACERAAVEPFFVDGQDEGRVRLGIEAGHWSAFSAALTACDPRTYAEYVLASGGRHADLIARVQPGALRDSPTLTIMRYLHDPAVPLTIGATVAVTIDRWERDDDRLRSPVNNRRATDIASEPTLRVRVAEHELRTFPPFDRPRFDAVDFPIDVVYLWVDGSDPDWQARRDRRLSEVTGRPLRAEATSDERFRDHGELRYSMRSVRRFAPWVRRIYLVTDRQRPGWLADHPELTVVDHRDIFDDPTCLPTFNSHAISARLHHIDGLSEHYLVFNDDVLLTRPITPHQLFDGNGVAHFSLSRATIPAGPIRADDLPHDAARKRVRDLVEEAYGRTVTQAFKHTPIAQRRSWQYELERRYAEHYRRTAATPFRSVDDIEPLSWLHHYTAYFEGLARPTAMPYAYFSISEEAALVRLEQLDPSSVMCICVNDADTGDLSDDQRHARLTTALRRLEPDPCDLERRS